MLFLIILVYVVCRIFCRYLDRQADKLVYDYNHSTEESSFNEERKIKAKVKRLESLRRIISFGSNAFLIMSIVLFAMMSMLH